MTPLRARDPRCRALAMSVGAKRFEFLGWPTSLRTFAKGGVDTLRRDFGVGGGTVLKLQAGGFEMFV